MDELLPLVYDELRKVATHKLIGEVPGQSITTSDLVTRLTSNWWAVKICRGKVDDTSSGVAGGAAVNQYSVHSERVADHKIGLAVVDSNPLGRPDFCPCEASD